MSQTTGPIVAVGAITFVNQTVLNGQPINWKVPVATAGAAAMFGLGEKVWPEGFTALAYLALVTVLFVRVQKGTPAPVESFLKFTGNG